MATKNISITEEAYKLLIRRKIREKESFSEIITREFGNKFKLKNIYGILKDKGNDFEKQIKSARQENKKSYEKRHKDLTKEFA